MIPIGAGETIGKEGAPESSSVGPNGVITPGPPHEGSRVTPEGRIISVPPDVCLTPRGSAMVPVPYKIWAYQKEATNLANTVLQTTLRSHVKGSIIRECYGDEAGTGGGVKSGTHNAECTPKTWSQTVLWESRNAVRDSDEWWMNKENTWGVLDYKKDTSQYDTPASNQVDAKMYLAQVSGTMTMPQAGSPAQSSTPPTPSQSVSSFVKGSASLNPLVRKLKCYDLNQFLENKPSDKHDYYIKEYCRQLKMQQDGTNRMSTNQFNQEQQSFQESGRLNDQSSFKAGLTQGYIDELTAGGMSLSDARNAAQIAAPLHNPDQVWGNSVVDALGDPNVNSSIGGGAPSRVAQLKNMLSGDKQSKSDKLNVKLCAELDGKEVC